MGQVKCRNAERCMLNCVHKVPHEPIHNGGFNYSYHNCRDERTLMCGRDEEGHELDGECESLEDAERNERYERLGVHNGETSGRCKGCSIRYIWKGLPRLKDAYCPGCGHKLIQTTYLWKGTVSRSTPITKPTR